MRRYSHAANFNRRHSTRLLTASLAVLALILAGRGGTSPNGLANPAAVDSQQPPLVAQANRICRRVNGEFAAKKAENAGVILEIIRLVPHRVMLETETARQLSSLTPTASLAKDWPQIVTYRRMLAHQLAELVRSAKANDRRAIAILTTTKRQAHEKLYKLAMAHGLTDCGQTG